MAKKYKRITSDSADEIELSEVWADKTSIEDIDEGLDSENWKISSGKINTDNVSVGWNNNFLLPNAIDDILFYDKTYLVVQIGGETKSYKISDEYDVTEVEISDSYSTKMNCKSIEFNELPEYIRDSVLEEEI